MRFWGLASPLKTSSRNAASAWFGRRARSSLIGVSRQTEAGKLPTGVGGKKISVACADMAHGRDAGAAAQDLLSAHEFSIVFRRCAFARTEARVGGEGAACPFPDVAEHLPHSGFCCRRGSGAQQIGLQEIAFDGIVQCDALP